MKKIVLFAAAAALFATGAQAQLTPPPGRALPPQVQQEVDLAYLLADGDMYAGYLPTLMGALTNPGKETPLQTLGRIKELIAVKAMDNLYYIGSASVGTWTVVTPDGLILFDAMNNTADVQNIILPGMKKLGLNPAKIKYLIIMHGHGDHYGGAKYIQDTYHPKVLMGAADWDMLDALGGMRGGRPTVPGPKRDVAVTDGQEVTLGGVTVKLYVTKGHTPATLSAIFPTTWHGKRHVVSFWGGNGMPTTLEPTQTSGGLVSYRAELVRYTRLAAEAGADTLISNHPVTDGTVDRAKKVPTLKPNEDSPWIVGRSTLLRLMGSNIVAMDAGIAGVRAGVYGSEK
jgi:metallo-beta-lactamase class B